jgi:hypothetical protein
VVTANGFRRLGVEATVMRFTLADALEAAERLIRGRRADDLAAAQQRAMREDSIPNLVRDMLAETLQSLVRRLRGQPPID